MIIIIMIMITIIIITTTTAKNNKTNETKIKEKENKKKEKGGALSFIRLPISHLPDHFSAPLNPETLTPARAAREREIERERR